MADFSALFNKLRPWLHQLVIGEELAPADAGVAPEENSAADKVIRASLEYEPIALRNRISSRQEMILAAHPIVSSDAVIGTVVVEQDIDDILSFRAALS